jgi:hypothetical protein
VKGLRQLVVHNTNQLHWQVRIILNWERHLL